MARRKLTEEEKNAKFQKSIEERQAFDISEMRRRYINTPTILYSVGEQIIYGAHPNAEIVEVYDDNKFYKVRAWGNYKEYHNTVYREVIRIVSWNDIKKFRTKEQNDGIEIFTQDDELHLSYFQTQMSEIFGKVYHFGLDDEPIYQRGNVWNLEDKQKLIDSIFKNVDIGKFVFVHLPYEKDCKSYEILDGKQRINAIIEFYEDRFSFNGKKYSELNWRDQNHFEHYGISVAEIKNATPKQKLLYFLKLNTGGRLVDPKHLEYVQKLYDMEG